MTPSILSRRFGAALLALSLPLAAMPAQTASAQAPKASLADVSKAIRAITTFKASFDQTNPNGTVQTGTVLLKQPGHIRFDFDGGDFLIVSDGRSLYMIDYEVSQQERWPIRNSPLGALLDPGRDLTRYGKLLPTGSPNSVSVEVHDKDHPEAGTMTLAFTRKAGAPGGLELYGWLIKDAQGNITSIRLRQVSYGVPIADSAFKWTDPRGNRLGPRR